MTRRIALRLLPGFEKPERGNIFQKIYAELGVALTRLIDTRSGFVALCYSEKDVDAILSPEALTRLKTIGLEPRTPPEITAQRSIICRRIDPFVGSHTCAELKTEITRLQPWCNIKEIIKFGTYTHVFKIVLTDITMTQKALEEGLICFNMRITPDQMEKEIFTNIQICFKCYVMEEHITGDCPKGNYKICSECGSLDHIWKDCRSETKKCINCGGGHRTMAMSCPKRKEIIKHKQDLEQKKKKDKEMHSYAKVAQIFKDDQRQNNIQLQIENNTPIQIITCIVHAHFMNIGCPGTFKQEVNKMLRMNGLEEMEFPENPPSEEIFKVSHLMPSRAQQTESPATEMTDMDIQTDTVSSKALEKKWEKRMEREGEMDLGSELGSRESILSATEVPGESKYVGKGAKSKSQPQRSREDRRSREMKPPEQPSTLEGKDINLLIYIPERHQHIPVRDLRDVSEGIKNKLFKWTYDAHYEEQYIESLILKGNLKILKENIITVSNDVFNKKRSGKIKSPAKGHKEKQQLSKDLHTK